MSRDYKNINQQKDSGQSLIARLFSFASGLSIGLFIAFVVFLYGDELREHSILRDLPKRDTAVAEKPQSDEKAVTQTQVEELPQPEFSFYEILPNKKVNISEWIAEMQETGKTGTDNTSLYVFQVGSFKDFKSADQVKAQLALLGISATIQRTVINGQDTVHRVRVGPFRDPEQLKQTRKQLTNNNIEYIPLKLNVEDLPGNGQ